MSFFSRLKSGLSKTSSSISTGITDIFTKRKLDDEMLEELEELLIAADLGAATAASIVAEFSKGRFDKEIAPEEVKTELARLIAQRLEKVAVPLMSSSCGLTGAVAPSAERAEEMTAGSHATEQESLDPAIKSRDDKGTHVILVVGVNGNGKTTTIGKLAHWLKESRVGSEEAHKPVAMDSRLRGNDILINNEPGSSGSSMPHNHSTLDSRLSPLIILSAADTFRAAAVEQLQVWGERTGCEVITGAAQADPASVAYAAMERAKAQQADVLMVDTAGRLHNKSNLMDELAKIVKVIKKLEPDAPHSVVLVLDATTGQNALQQVQAFKELVNVTGLVVTKLDGTAKAGVVVALAEQFGLPIHAIGVGEGIDDLQPFDPLEFAQGLVG